jgi:hypothetical protein
MSFNMRSFGTRLTLGLILGSVGAVFAFMESTSTALSDNNPAIALRLNGGNEIAAQRMATSQMKNFKDAKSMELARDLTLGALKNAAGLAPSIRNYALLSEQKLLPGDPSALMQIASQFSRRDLPTQLWFIEREAQSGDVGRTLSAYDLALTSNPEIQPILFPIMAKAVADPELTQPIANMLKRDPTWAPQFFAHFYQNADAIQNFPLLLSALGTDAERLIPINMRQSLAQSLVKKGEWDAAFQTSLLGKKSVKLSDFGNDEQRISPPFGWAYSPSGNVGFSLDQQQNLSVQVGRGAGATIATRTVRLPSPNFKFSALIESNNAILEQIPRFVIFCADKNLPGKRLIPILASKGRFTVSDNVTLPTCRFATIQIAIPSNFSSPEYAVTLSGVSLQ